MERLLTARQLSELLQVGESTVYKWTHMEFIPHVKLGGSIRFVAGDVKAWVAARSHQGRKAMKYNVGGATVG